MCIRDRSGRAAAVIAAGGGLRQPAILVALPEQGPIRPCVFGGVPAGFAPGLLLDLECGARMLVLEGCLEVVAQLVGGLATRQPERDGLAVGGSLGAVGRGVG